MPKPQFFAGPAGPYAAPWTAGANRTRERTLTAGALARVVAIAAKDHQVKAGDVKLVSVQEFEKPYKDGSIGEVSVRYNAHNEAIYGFYSDGRIELWAD